METLHNIIQKVLTLVFALSFAFVAIYVPQSWHKNTDLQIEPAQAGLRALESTQWLNKILLGKSLIEETITAVATKYLAFKDSVLDGLSWVAAKGFLGVITNEVVSWVNSGFNGQPAFVQDLQGYLTRQGLNVFNEFYQEIPVANYIPDPFKFDVQNAFADIYAQARSGNPTQTPAADLTGSLQNLDKFVAGSFSDGGWDAWLKVAVQPNTYTPYGNIMAVQQEASERMQAKQANEDQLVSLGDGFMSNKVCRVLEIGGVDRERCEVSTPGQVISEALNFQLTVGQESLIASDEVQEMLGSLLQQVGLQAISGAAGLLGLSGGTGYTDTTHSTGSYVDEINKEQEEIADEVAKDLLVRMQENLQVENEYFAVTQIAVDRFNKVVAMNPNSPSTQAFVNELNYIQNALQPEINIAILGLNNLITSFNNKSSSSIEIYNDYRQMKTHTKGDVDSSVDKWFTLFRNLFGTDQLRLETFESTARRYWDLFQLQIDKGVTVVSSGGVDPKLFKDLKDARDAGDLDQTQFDQIIDNLNDCMDPKAVLGDQLNAMNVLSTLSTQVSAKVVSLVEEAMNDCGEASSANRISAMHDEIWYINNKLIPALQRALKSLETIEEKHNTGEYTPLQAIDAYLALSSGASGQEAFPDRAFIDTKIAYWNSLLNDGGGKVFN